jgi:hypothetical protein
MLILLTSGPLIVVFTKYDLLVFNSARMLLQDPSCVDLSDEELNRKAKQMANSEYQEHIVNYVENFASQHGITFPLCVRVSST